MGIWSDKKANVHGSNHPTTGTENIEEKIHETQLVDVTSEE